MLSSLTIYVLLAHVMFGDKIANTLRQAGHTVIQINPVQTTNFDLKKLDHKDNWIRWPKTVSVEETIRSRLANEMWEMDALSLGELFRVSYFLCFECDIFISAISRCRSTSR
jgi:hypothetical protein